MQHILFAIGPLDHRETREVSEYVANRFDGRPETTELVGVRDFGRLYRMESAAS